MDLALMAAWVFGIAAWGIDEDSGEPYQRENMGEPTNDNS